MRSLFVVVFALGCGAGTQASEAKSQELPPAVSTEPAKGELTTARFLSASLGVEKRYFIYLPADYQNSQASYPVIYMLHGLGGSEDNWSKHMNLTDAADAMRLPAIVVMPDGDDSFYVNSATAANYEECKKNSAAADANCVKSANFEDYIAKDWVAHIDATYRTKADVSARAIGGLSMGGYGALVLAMLHKDVFSSVASHSGVTSLLFTGPVPFVSGKANLADDAVTFAGQLGRIGVILRGIFGDKIESWRAHDPTSLAHNLDDGDLAIYLDCGTEDEFLLQHGASYLHEILESRGVAHSFTLLPGGHNVEFWTAQIDDSLAFHLRHFEKSGALPAR